MSVSMMSCVANLKSAGFFNNNVLGSAWEEIFATHVFSYLATDDLCSASSACTFFHHSSQIATLWLDLKMANFTFPNEASDESTGPNNADFAAISNTASDEIVMNLSNRELGIRNCDSTALTLPYCPTAKEKYSIRLQDRSLRYQEARDKAALHEGNRLRERKQRCLQSFLDITLFRILIPLPQISFFLSIILFTLHYDGSDIPIWACAAPLLFYFVYLLVCSLISWVVYKQVSVARVNLTSGILCTFNLSMHDFSLFFVFHICLCFVIIGTTGVFDFFCHNIFNAEI